MRIPAADTARGAHCPRLEGWPREPLPPKGGFPARGVRRADRMSYEGTAVGGVGKTLANRQYGDLLRLV